MNYKPKNDEEEAIMAEADKVDRIDDKRQFWMVGMITMWLASVAVIFILPNSATAWLAFLVAAIACGLREQRPQPALLRPAHVQPHRRRLGAAHGEGRDHHPRRGRQ